MRAKVTDGTTSGNEIKSLMNKGMLVPDELAHQILDEHVRRALAKADVSGVLLDGYPRTVKQAHLLDDTLSSMCINNFKVVDIKLETSVAVAKLLNRKQCETCGDSFNTAHIVEGTYDMPAILPDPATCRLKERCHPVLSMRGDDTEETIKTRLHHHDVNVAPILDYYDNKGVLKTFHVHKGVKDVDALIEVMMS